MTIKWGWCVLMPNCDWGRPCDCLDCRTVYDEIECPQCGFKNVVSIVRTASYTVDHKGIGDYNFSAPGGFGRNFPCFKCGQQIRNVKYYTEIDLDGCKRNLARQKRIEEGRICSQCKKVEESDEIDTFRHVHLREKNGVLVCQKCLADITKKETPNPSNELEKYEFDDKKLAWKLVRVKKPCAACGKPRWLNLENQWKTLCTNCYKQKHQ